MRRPALAVLLLMPCLALAQSTDDRPPGQTTNEDDRWHIGLAASVRDSPYAGEGTRTRPLPLLGFEGERVFWRGLSGGVHLVDGPRFTLDAIVSGRFDGFDIEDLGAGALRANGLEPDLLDDRDDGLDIGLAAAWRGRAGELALEALADVTDASGGQEVSLSYGYPLQWGSFSLVPGAGVRWMSKDLANYYYGVLDEEVARGMPSYRPGSAVVPEISLGFARPLGGKWRLTGSLKYEFLPDELSDSPFLEPDTSGTGRLVLGLSRGF